MGSIPLLPGVAEWPIGVRRLANTASWWTISGVSVLSVARLGCETH